MLGSGNYTLHIMLVTQKSILQQILMIKTQSFAHKGLKNCSTRCVLRAVDAFAPDPLEELAELHQAL